MYLPEFIHSVDPSLGRVNCSLFPDQTLMEMLVEGFGEEPKKMYQDKDGAYLDVCDWSNVECDEDERVRNVVEYCVVGGSLALRYVPPRVKKFIIPSSNLVGTIDLADLCGCIVEICLEENLLSGPICLRELPDSMEILNLNFNEFSGSVDLTHLPEGMREILFESNQFSGSLDLTQLPHGMRDIYLNDNQLSGMIDLTQLPGKMTRLSLSKNQFSGSVHLNTLPPSMRTIKFSNNALTGSLSALNLPLMLITIDASHNTFDAIAVVEAKSNTHVYFIESGVTSVTDENGKPKVTGVQLK